MIYARIHITSEDNLKGTLCLTGDKEKIAKLHNELLLLQEGTHHIDEFHTELAKEDFIPVKTIFFYKHS